jgi:hypothetical protein
MSRSCDIHSAKKGGELALQPPLAERPGGLRRRRAIAALAGTVGALTLARAVDDPALSTEILAAARDAFGKPLHRQG